MNVTVIAMGRLKESYLTDACGEYLKRLSAFGKAEVIELNPVKLPDEPSEKQIAAALDAEADKILEKVPKGAFLCAMCVEGKQQSSERLAKTLETAATGGCGSAVFVIGSSYGLSDRVKQAAALRLSMSEMTFPHQLARVMLLEQIYRAFTITAGKKYHK